MPEDTGQGRATAKPSRDEGLMKQVQTELLASRYILQPQTTEYWPCVAPAIQYHLAEGPTSI